MTLRDNGTGMSAEVCARIFEPFFTTKPVGTGSGLGLAVAHGIITQSGGTIEVETESGRGTTFRILLPAAAAGPEVHTRRGHAAVTEHGQSVLLVEDNEAVRRVTSLFLREFGYSVVEAGGGVEALRAAEKMPAIDLVLTDMMMPEMSGKEFIRQLRALRPGVCVLFMSGYPRDGLEPGMLDGDRVGFISKPFSPVDLSRKVQSILKARS